MWGALNMGIISNLFGGKDKTAQMWNKKELTPYQRRATGMVWANRIYIVVAVAICGFGELGYLGWLIVATGFAVMYGIATMADAVFDSLHERLNMQSEWLDIRLRALENHEDPLRSGQLLWQLNGIPTDNLMHYHSSFPEILTEDEQRSAWDDYTELKAEIRNDNRQSDAE
jgi:hypothetical protein